VEWVWGLLQPSFVRWAPLPHLLHMTTLTTGWLVVEYGTFTTWNIRSWKLHYICLWFGRLCSLNYCHCSWVLQLMKKCRTHRAGGCGKTTPCVQHQPSTAADSEWAAACQTSSCPCATKYSSPQTITERQLVRVFFSYILLRCQLSRLRRLLTLATTTNSLIKSI